MRIPERPIIYEINTAVFLRELSQKHQRAITLASVPENEWNALAELPIDAVWLMGVWQRSAIGKELSLKNPEYKDFLPDITPEDVLGSAYCVQDYTVDRQFGGPDGLAEARRQLQAHGIALVLDFVPNHTALDHPWASSNPEYFIQGSERDAKHHPKAFYKEPSGIVIARGKDPNYEPWYDVVQLNAFSATYRQAAVNLLKNISEQCDGVRCDMAMLMCNEIFTKTWGERAGPVPSTEFWPSVIESVKVSNPDFLFLAEVYWDMQESLLAQGFNLCYDKDFYDIVDEGNANDLHKHLIKVQAYQKNLLRFIENHDEERAAKVLGINKSKAAAVILTLLENARLYLEGQFDGYPARIPVQLARGPLHEPDKDLQIFYKDLLSVSKVLNLQDAEWSLLKCKSAHLGVDSKHVIAWQWHNGPSVHVVVVNYSSKSQKVNLLLNTDKSSPLKTIFSEGIKDSEKVILQNGTLSIALNSWGYAVLELS
jgi:hypothetical protein